MFPLSNAFQKLLFFRCQICNNKHPGRIRGNCMVPLTRGGSGPITSSLLLTPHQHQTLSQTMINTCIQHAKTQTGCFSPLLDQSFDEVCHSIPSRGCMSNENCKSIVYGVIRKIAPPENTLIFVCNARTTTILQ